MTEITGLTSKDAMALLRHTLEQLEIHMEDPDESSLSGQGMLEVTRDRLSTLYALVVNLIPAPTDPRLTAQCPRCAECAEPIVWSEVRQIWTHRDGGTIAVPPVAQTAPGVGLDQADAHDGPALTWVLYRPRNGITGDVLVAAGASGPAPGTADPVEVARQQLAEHAADQLEWVAKVFGPDDRLRGWAQWEQGSAVGYVAGKAAK
jgi:hypothetical protein